MEAEIKGKFKNLGIHNINPDKKIKNVLFCLNKIEANLAFDQTQNNVSDLAKRRDDQECLEISRKRIVPGIKLSLNRFSTLKQVERQPYTALLGAAIGNSGWFVVSTFRIHITNIAINILHVL